MDFSLQVHEAKYIFPIPDGLKELSSDIIREVLRYQPSHINGFVADYLETMLNVREQTRESGVVICDAFKESYFFDELYKNKNVTREQAHSYATTIQANWRGYVVRKKISMWLKKKKKFDEEKERKRSLKIEELLAGLGITYDEARRAAGIIQSAYQESKRGKWVSGEFGEFWVGETIPFGQRLREGDRAQGRYDRWEKEDFGDFFEMDESGAIKYIWPRVGQLRKVLREEVPNDVPLVEFFAMRDLNGQEQYSYLIKSQPATELRGVPIGFLIPLPKACVLECSQEVQYLKFENHSRMGTYTYIFREDVDREELAKFEEILKAQEKVDVNFEEFGELEYDPHWVLPRILVRIKKVMLLETDDEVKFVSLPEGVICEQDNYTFRAETLEQSNKIIRHILRNKCLTVEEGLLEAANMKPYKFQETGRIFPVEKFRYPMYIQKLEITPESDTAESESLDLMRYNYIFLPLDQINNKKLPKGESMFSISIIRFQGFHSDYKGSSELDTKVFIMGPKVTTPDGKPFTYESLFWEEFGDVSWYQLLNDSLGEISGEGEEEGEHIQEISEAIEEEDLMGTSTQGETQSLKTGKTEDQSEADESRVQGAEAEGAADKGGESAHLSSAVVEAEGETRKEEKLAEEDQPEPPPEPEPEPEPEPALEPEPEPEKPPEDTEETKPE